MFVYKPELGSMLSILTPPEVVTCLPSNRREWTAFVDVKTWHVCVCLRARVRARSFRVVLAALATFGVVLAAPVKFGVVLAAPFTFGHVLAAPVTLVVVLAAPFTFGVVLAAFLFDTFI